MLVLICRGFFVLGVATPLVVEGSSMAPALRGTHLQVTCPECRQASRVGADQLPAAAAMDCPHCGSPGLSTADAPLRRGSSLIIDRRLDWPVMLRRWDVVVARRPDDARQLCVKRLLGLPGESIRFDHGNLLVNGALVRKSLEEQKRLRVLVHEETSRCSKWRSASGAWRFHHGDWVAQPSDGPSVLRFSPQRLTDALSYNQRVSRQLNPVVDVMLTAELHLAGSSRCEWTIEQRGARFSAIFDMVDREALVSIETPELQSERSAPLGASLADGRGEATFSLFDQQVCLAIGDRTLVAAELPPLASGGLDDPPRFSISVREPSARFGRIRVWRDVYYERRPADLPYDASGSWRLADDRWWLVGDNQAVSHDSRNWPAGGVPGRLLVGRAAWSP